MKKKQLILVILLKSNKEIKVFFVYAVITVIKQINKIIKEIN